MHGDSVVRSNHRWLTIGWRISDPLSKKAEFYLKKADY